MYIGWRTLFSRKYPIPMWYMRQFLNEVPNCKSYTQHRIKTSHYIISKTNNSSLLIWKSTIFAEHVRNACTVIFRSLLWYPLELANPASITPPLLTEYQYFPQHFYNYNEQWFFFLMNIHLKRCTLQSVEF